ncbi:hypothetical protein, partial [Shinella sp.]|uniref:hypothetical protein n=1 Tax=Shinella sp. TaxID=1870904 RepID=UPI00289AF2A3
GHEWLRPRIEEDEMLERTVTQHHRQRVEARIFPAAQSIGNNYLHDALTLRSPSIQIFHIKV